MKKRFMVVIILSLVLLLGACGGNSNNAGKAEGTNNKEDSPKTEQTKDTDKQSLPHAELVWYYPQPAIPADLKSVEDEVNKLIEPKINATVKLMPLGFGDYTQKLNTVIASSEKADLVWTSNWNFNYVQNQSKGAFISLDQLIDQYAPDVKASMPEFVWEATKINGEIYGIPNYQTVTKQEGFVLQQRYIDKIGLDTSSLKSLADIEPYLAQIKAEDSELIPLVMYRQGMFHLMHRMFGLEAVVDNAAVIHLSNPDKVVNVYETKEYRHYIDTIRSFYLKGYINEDAATIKSASDYEKAGRAVVGFHNVLKPGGEAESKIVNGGYDVQYVPLTEAYVGTNTIITTLQAIPVNSKNPERAMMLINLVNTDKDLFNLLAFGIEGKHYNKNADGTISKIQDSAYSAADWVFGNVFNGYTLEGKDPSVAEKTKQLNETAVPSPLIGFKFIADNVTAEIANVSTVIDEYAPGLNTGTIDPDKMLSEFQNKLKQAGIDKIVEEAQRQLDEWKEQQ